MGFNIQGALLKVVRIAKTQEDLSGLQLEASKHSKDYKLDAVESNETFFCGSCQTEHPKSLYFWSKVMGYDFPNANGDAVPRKYAVDFGPSFIGRHLDADHKIDSEHIIGKIAESWHVEVPLTAKDEQGNIVVLGHSIKQFLVDNPSTGELQVEAICRVDRTTNLGCDIAKKLLSGILNAVSQEASTEFALCSVCKHRMNGPNDLRCEHVTPGSLMMKAYEVDDEQAIQAAEEVLKAALLNEGMRLKAAKDSADHAEFYSAIFKTGILGKNVIMLGHPMSAHVEIIRTFLAGGHLEAAKSAIHDLAAAATPKLSILAYKIHHNPVATGLAVVTIPAYDQARVRDLVADVRQGKTTMEIAAALLREQEAVYGKSSILASARQELEVIGRMRLSAEAKSALEKLNGVETLEVFNAFRGLLATPETSFPPKDMPKLETPILPTKKLKPQDENETSLDQAMSQQDEGAGRVTTAKMRGRDRILGAEEVGIRVQAGPLRDLANMIPRTPGEAVSNLKTNLGRIKDGVKKLIPGQRSVAETPASEAQLGASVFEDEDGANRICGNCYNALSDEVKAHFHETMDEIPSDEPCGECGEQLNPQEEHDYDQESNTFGVRTFVTDADGDEEEETFLECEEDGLNETFDRVLEQAGEKFAVDGLARRVVEEESGETLREEYIDTPPTPRELPGSDMNIESSFQRKADPLNSYWLVTSAGKPVLRLSLGAISGGNLRGNLEGANKTIALQAHLESPRYGSDLVAGIKKDPKVLKQALQMQAKWESKSIVAAKQPVSADDFIKAAKETILLASFVPEGETKVDYLLCRMAERTDVFVAKTYDSKGVLQASKVFSYEDFHDGKIPAAVHAEIADTLVKHYAVKANEDEDEEAGDENSWTISSRPATEADIDAKADIAKNGGDAHPSNFVVGYICDNTPGWGLSGTYLLRKKEVELDGLFGALCEEFQSEAGHSSYTQGNGIPAESNVHEVPWKPEFEKGIKASFKAEAPQAFRCEKGHEVPYEQGSKLMTREGVYCPTCPPNTVKMTQAQSEHAGEGTTPVEAPAQPEGGSAYNILTPTRVFGILMNAARPKTEVKTGDQSYYEQCQMVSDAIEQLTGLKPMEVIQKLRDSMGRGGQQQNKGFIPDPSKVIDMPDDPEKLNAFVKAVALEVKAALEDEPVKNRLEQIQKLVKMMGGSEWVQDDENTWHFKAECLDAKAADAGDTLSASTDVYVSFAANGELVVTHGAEQGSWRFIDASDQSLREIKETLQGAMDAMHNAILAEVEAINAMEEALKTGKTFEEKDPEDEEDTRKESQHHEHGDHEDDPRAVSASRFIKLRAEDGVPVDPLANEPVEPFKKVVPPLEELEKKYPDIQFIEENGFRGEPDEIWARGLGYSHAGSNGPDYMERSNYNYMLKELGGDNEAEGVRTRGDFIDVRVDSPHWDRFVEIMAEYENYPDLDEQGTSELEFKACEADWDGDGKQDALKLCVEAGLAEEDAEFESLPEQLRRDLYEAFGDVWFGGSGDYSSDRMTEAIKEAIADWQNQTGAREVEAVEAEGQQRLPGLESGRRTMKGFEAKAPKGYETLAAFLEKNVLDGNKLKASWTAWDMKSKGIKASYFDGTPEVAAAKFTAIQKAWPVIQPWFATLSLLSKVDKVAALAQVGDEGVVKLLASLPLNHKALRAERKRFMETVKAAKARHDKAEGTKVKAYRVMFFAQGEEGRKAIDAFDEGKPVLESAAGKLVAKYPAGSQDEISVLMGCVTAINRNLGYIGIFAEEMVQPEEIPASAPEAGEGNAIPQVRVGDMAQTPDGMSGEVTGFSEDGKLAQLKDGEGRPFEADSATLQNLSEQGQQSFAGYKAEVHWLLEDCWKLVKAEKDHMALLAEVMPLAILLDKDFSVLGFSNSKIRASLPKTTLMGTLEGLCGAQGLNLIALAQSVAVFYKDSVFQQAEPVVQDSMLASGVAFDDSLVAYLVSQSERLWAMVRTQRACFAAMDSEEVRGAILANMLTLAPLQGPQGGLFGEVETRLGSLEAGLIGLMAFGGTQAVKEDRIAAARERAKEASATVSASDAALKDLEGTLKAFDDLAVGSEPEATAPPTDEPETIMHDIESKEAAMASLREGGRDYDHSEDREDGMTVFTKGGQALAIYNPESKELAFLASKLTAAEEALGEPEEIKEGAKQPVFCVWYVKEDEAKIKELIDEGAFYLQVFNPDEEEDQTPATIFCNESKQHPDIKITVTPGPNGLTMVRLEGDAEWENPTMSPGLISDEDENDIETYDAEGQSLGGEAADWGPVGGDADPAKPAVSAGIK